MRRRVEAKHTRDKTAGPARGTPFFVLDYITIISIIIMFLF